MYFFKVTFLFYLLFILLLSRRFQKAIYAIFKNQRKLKNYKCRKYKLDKIFGLKVVSP